MTYVHVGKIPVPRCIVPSFSNEVFYPGSAPAGVTPQYFTTLNVYQQWLQIFGPDVPLPEDERNLPGYPQSNLYTVTGEEGPRYRYCSKERVWKPRSYFPISNGRFLSTCSHCKGSDFRRAAKRREESLENRNEDLSQGIQPNQDVIARFAQPSMPIVNTDQRKYSVANLPLMPKAKPYTAKPVPKYATSAPVFATPALGPSKKTILRLKELKEMQSDAERLQSHLFGHKRIKKLYEANLEKLTMTMDCVSEESEDNRDKRMTEATRLQDRISKEDNILNETRSKLDDVNLAIDLMAEMNRDDIGYQNNNEDTVLPSIEEEWNAESLYSPGNFDNTSEEGVEFAGQTNDVLRFSPTPHGYPPLDEDCCALSNNETFVQNPEFFSGLDGTVKKDSGDGTGDVDMKSAFHTLARVSAGVPRADSSILVRYRDNIDSNFQELSNFQTKSPKPQNEVDLNRFRALSVSKEVQDRHAKSYQAQSRQPSPRQRFKFHARTPSTSRDLDLHWPCQASGHNSSCLQSQKVTNAPARHSPSTVHTPGSNQDHFKNPNPTAVFQFGQSTLGDSGSYDMKMEENFGKSQTIALRQTREIAQQVQQLQADATTKFAQVAQKAKNIYDQIAQQARLAQEARELQEAHDELAQDQVAEDQLAQKAMDARDVYDQIAYEKRTRQNELTPKVNVAHDQLDQDEMYQDQLDQDQLAEDQLAQKAIDARDIYDERAYEIRDQKNVLAEHVHHAHDQLSQLSQQTQLAQQEQQEIRTQKAEYQARRQRKTFESLPNFHSLPILELAQPNQTTQPLKRRAEESPGLPNQHQPEHSIRRSKRARHRAETEAEMQEREDMRAKRIQRRAEILELQQIEKATKLSLESVRRSKMG
ncbi:hypothetical protein BPAE_0562g00020 [Botrytis paeoniae]|uniref:Uncharacterized protein n=1 Tax=Botrytis paeoniae TaxID=278948 RepID=A0A4Z1EX83_9HELO|nr:hypothetical protein BPAE_0562g00020 [Botrytis paeoniae]